MKGDRRKGKKRRKTLHCLTETLRVLALYPITLLPRPYAPLLPPNSCDTQTHRLSHFSSYPLSHTAPLARGAPLHNLANPSLLSPNATSSNSPLLSLVPLGTHAPSKENTPRSSHLQTDAEKPGSQRSMECFLVCKCWPLIQICNKLCSDDTKNMKGKSSAAEAGTDWDCPLTTWVTGYSGTCPRNGGL